MIRTSSPTHPHPRIFMMDLWATVPYYTAYLCRALQQIGAKVTVGSISYYLDPTCFSSRGLQTAPGAIDLVGRFPLPRLPRRILKLAEALVNLGALTVRFLLSPPDILHVQYLPMLQWRVPLDLWFLQLIRKRGSRIVLTVHDLLPHDTAELHLEIFRRLYHQVDGIICHSESVKSRLIDAFAVDAEIVSVIPHGPFFYDLPQSSSEDLGPFGVPAGNAVVLWQGILFPYKGVDLLLEAWKLVEQAQPKATLLVVGTGPPALLEEIRQQQSRLGLRQVSLVPRFVSTTELVSLYRAADVVVYPYRAITTSGALATGLALGKAIVASNLPVFRELLTDGHNALLVDPADAKELSHALLRLLQDDHLRSELSRRIEDLHFGDRSWTMIADKTMQAYDDALGRPAHPQGKTQLPEVVSVAGRRN